MLRNALAAALRHLRRSRLSVLIGVGGLAVGICAALIAALVIRNQYTYDHFIPEHDRVHVIQAAFAPPGLVPEYAGLTLLGVAERLRTQLPEVEAATRVLQDAHHLRVGERRFGDERVHWADPNAFGILPLPVHAGDAPAALAQADGVVLSRSAARRFFGRDSPLGETLLIDERPMVVRAVIQDLPFNGSHENFQVIGSGLAAHSPMHQKPGADANVLGGQVLASGYTYVRLKPGADLAPLTRLLEEITQPRGSEPYMLSLELVRLDRLNAHEGLNPGFRSRMLTLALLGAVVLLIAAVNFVNLQTAMAARRAREVAVRKLAGAARGTLVAQFLAEALAHALAAGLIALALTEWLLPQVNAFLDSGARFDYAGEPWILLVLLGLVLLLGALSGAWPALIVSGFRPVAVLRGETAVGSGAVLARQALVAVQFALLIALGICAGVVHRQREFAMTEALRLDGEQVLIVSVPRSPALADEVRRLPGVRAVTRANVPFLGTTGYKDRLRGVSISTIRGADGQPVSLNVIGADFDLFDFYGIRPIAGELPRPDGVSARRIGADKVVLNETAVRRLGLGKPAEIVGKPVNLSPPGRPGTPESPSRSELLAVVPDFTLSPVTERIPPMAYFQPGPQADLLNVRLSGREIPETLAAIDALWRRMGDGGAGSNEPPLRFFFGEHIQNHYVSTMRQAQAFGICALIAIVLACIGLFALTAAAAARRTREIALRKALGAETRAILQLLLWQFTRPVLWGALIAWPVAAWIMHRWLQGFAYRIELPLWMFLAATLAAVIIAMLTVIGHTVTVARTRPAMALRYE